MRPDPREREWLIGPAPHLGDTYFTCALAGAFLCRHGGSEVGVVVPRKLWTVLELFPDARVSPRDPAEVTAPFRETRGFRPGEPFHLRPLRHAREFEASYRGQTIPFTRTYHDLLEVPFPAFARPCVPTQTREAAARRLATFGLPTGETVILVPVSNSGPAFSSSFWADLAQAFAARGAAVATNVAPGDGGRTIPGTVPLPCPPDELIPVAELAGTVVAARCGVCDVLSSARADLRILYHRPQYEWSPLAGVKLECDLGPCGLDDTATYYRMGVSEPRAEFIARVAAGQR